MRPRVGISRCLLGDPVRYDGTDKRADDLLREFSDHVEWVSVCPEVEVGMGTPREPIHFVTIRRQTRLVGVNSGKDWTETMRAWAEVRARELAALNLSGYIFKSRSPSCGIGDTPGVFARAMIEALPDLPIADEEQLNDPMARVEFLKRILHHRRPGPLPPGAP